LIKKPRIQGWVKSTDDRLTISVDYLNLCIHRLNNKETSVNINSNKYTEDYVVDLNLEFVALTASYEL